MLVGLCLWTSHRCIRRRKRLRICRSNFTVQYAALTPSVVYYHPSKSDPMKQTKVWVRVSHYNLRCSSCKFLAAFIAKGSSISTAGVVSVVSSSTLYIYPPIGVAGGKQRVFIQLVPSNKTIFELDYTFVVPPPPVCTYMSPRSGEPGAIVTVTLNNLGAVYRRSGWRRANDLAVTLERDYGSQNSTASYPMKHFCSVRRVYYSSTTRTRLQIRLPKAPLDPGLWNL